MRKFGVSLALAVCALAGGGTASSAQTLTGSAAFGDWRDDAPTVRRLIKPGDLPQPYATPSARNRAGTSTASDDNRPDAPEGFEVSLFARDLDGPRTIRVAPNGDVFVAESDGNRVRVFRPTDGGEPSEGSIFAGGLNYPYGIAFYPPGPEPEYVYVAEEDKVVRFPYRNGDLEASGDPETIVDGIPTGGHSTRDIAFSLDGKRMFLAVGSASNIGSGMRRASPSDIAEIEAENGVGAAWGPERGRAAVFAFAPDGTDRRPFANGIRNCSGLAVQPTTGEVWCATNERDGLGDNLPPDYVSRIRERGFYGWPWYYIGANQDPRHEGERPDLADKVTVPDVLIQPHSAPLGMTFYDGEAFPPEVRGDAFVALHGSWNRTSRTGYKVVRVLMENGVPTGEYEDFLTGFVASDGSVWGRPVGVAATRDGSLLVSEDRGGTIWRVAYRGE